MRACACLIVCLKLLMVNCFIYEEIGYVYLAFKLAWQNSELEILFFPRARFVLSSPQGPVKLDLLTRLNLN